MQSPHNRDESHLQILTNWLAVIVLLGVGFIWPPADAADAPAAADAGREVIMASPAPGNLTSQPHAGTLFLKSSHEAAAVPALRQSTTLSARVTANVARVYVTQTFTNHSEDWVEGLYVFPLSTGVAVDELEMQVGDRWIRGDIKPRETAHAVYEQAKSEGKRASLVDQNRPRIGRRLNPRERRPGLLLYCPREVVLFPANGIEVCDRGAIRIAADGIRQDADQGDVHRAGRGDHRASPALAHQTRAGAGHCAADHRR